MLVMSLSNQYIQHFKYWERTVQVIYFWVQAAFEFFPFERKVFKSRI